MNNFSSTSIKKKINKSIDNKLLNIIRIITKNFYLNQKTMDFQN